MAQWAAKGLKRRTSSTSIPRRMSERRGSCRQPAREIARSSRHRPGWIDGDDASEDDDDRPVKGAPAIRASAGRFATLDFDDDEDDAEQEDEEKAKEERYDEEERSL